MHQEQKRKTRSGGISANIHSKIPAMGNAISHPSTTIMQSVIVHGWAG